jgi:F-box protein 42
MNMDNLPEELLEKVFSFTSQYKDYINISRVCKKWYRIIQGLRLLNKTTFNECFQNGLINWKQLEQKISPTQRHSHSCCQINDRMYLFGGLSGTSTSYNDLWFLDLNTKIWNRPTTNGSYPSPKAAASLLAYNNNCLILYGGYSHPYSHPFNQQVSFFDELHIYCIETFTWNQILFAQEAPPKLAGHTASIINKNQMILFGGCNGSLGNKTNSVYCLDLDTFEWCLPARDIDGLKPECRYGHSQMTLNDERILIVGGCGGPNRKFALIFLFKSKNKISNLN